MKRIGTDMFQARRSYRWLMAMITIMTAVAVTIGILMLGYVESRLVATTGESLALAAAEVADKLDRLVFERYMDSRILAQGFRRHMSDRRYLAAHLTWVMQSSPMYLWLGVTDAQGVVIAATNPKTMGHDYSSEPWFQAARSGETHIGDVEPYEAAGGVDSIAFTAPILGSDEEFLGTVTSQMALPALEDVVTQAIRMFQEREGFLGTLEYQFLTRDGDAFVDSDLAHKGNVNLKRLGLPSAQLLDFGQPGHVLERHLRRGVDVVTGYAKMEGRHGNYSLGWGVLLRVDRSDILSPIRRVLWRLVAAGSAVWVPMFVILLWATSRLRIEWAQARHESARARKAEATLREQNERFELVNQATNDWVWDWNVETNDVWWNDKLEVLFGYSAKETPHSFEFWHQSIHPDDRERITSSQKAVLQAGERVWSGEYRFRRADGTYADVMDRAYALYDANGKPQRMIGSVRDITEGKQAEKRQAAQLAVSLALAESTTMQDASPRFLQAVCDTTGWEFGALWLVDRSAKVLSCQAVWHRPDHDLEGFAAISHARQFSMGLGLPGRVWAGGQPAWIPDVVHDGNFPRAPAAAKVGLHAACGFPILLANEVIGVLEFFSYEIRQPDTQLLTMMADTGIKIGQFIERQQLEQQLRQAQKMEAIGQLAGGIAHDFNNVLTVIAGYSELLLARTGREDPLYGELQEIRKAGNRAAALTNQLLAFSRRQVLAPKLLNLNEVVSGVEQMLRRLIGEDIELITILGPDLGVLKADPGQVEQVIINLAVNARDAMAKGGKLTIQTANGLFERPQMSERVIIQPGRYVILTVSDTGHGMDAKTQSRIFEPFFTTKEKGKGTGLGLATVYGIVKQSDGYITVYSALGRGTTFKIYLPMIAREAEAEPQPRTLPLSPPLSSDGADTILVVEDEEIIRSLVTRILTAHRYRVLAAANAKEALQLCNDYSAPVHLLLTDVVMPEISGQELARRLASQRPEMRVLYMSGYTDDAVVRHGVLQERMPFLQKPFTPDMLARKVREVLNSW